MSTLSTIEAMAAISGLLCVALLIRQNIWTWPVGLIQVSLYIVIFFRVKLYSDLLLHIIYVFLQLYGWHHWLRGGENRGMLAVTSLGRRAAILWAAVAIGGSAAWGFMMARATDAALPYGDAFALVTSLVAQWLTNRKKLESWLFWIAVDVVAIGVFYAKDLHFTVALYVLFLVMAVFGYRTWRQDLTGGGDASRIDAREVRATS